MKIGDLVFFSARHLSYDYDILRGQHGILLEQLDIDLKPNGIERCWRVLFVEKKIVVYESDISVVKE